MAPRMLWLVMVVRVTSAPVFLGALFMLAEPPPSGNSLAAAGGLIVLGAIHVFYWWRPWPSRERQAIAAAAGVVVTNFVLLDLLGLSQPLLWLYPALIVGAGLRPVAAVGVGLTALAAAAPMAAESRLAEPHDFSEPFGASHSILLSIVLAGLGMTAVRQLIAVNADLHATRAELADLAVAGERERLARELHDLLGRTLSLIAVKAELASRLSAKADPSAEAELQDVQRLARQQCATCARPSLAHTRQASTLSWSRPTQPCGWLGSKPSSRTPARALILRTRRRSPGRCARR